MVNKEKPQSWSLSSSPVMHQGPCTNPFPHQFRVVTSCHPIYWFSLIVYANYQIWTLLLFWVAKSIYSICNHWFPFCTFQPLCVPVSWSHQILNRNTFDLSPTNLGFPGYPSGKESTCQCKRHGFDHWVGKIPGGGYGNPLQYSYLENLRQRRLAMGLQRVRPDWGTKHSTSAYYYTTIL